jgi:hypothetical protein
MSTVGLSSGWQQEVMLLLTTINSVLGQPQRTQPRRPLEPPELVQIAEELIGQKYDPASRFDLGPVSAGAAGSPSATLANPGDTASYLLPNLQGSNPANSRLSVAEGGVLYEDPFWFVLAAYGIGRTGRLAILPKGIPRKAWEGRAEALQQLRSGAWAPGNWFAMMQPVGSGNGLPAALRQTTGAEIAKMRFTGRALLNEPGSFPKMYSLYGYGP